MKLYNLGRAAWPETQLIYHALADLGREAVCLVSPASPYVSIGYHQELDQEIDLEFCRAEKIPIFRREVGGGAVYLDGNQLFFQLVIKKDNPLAPANHLAFYRKFLQPAIDAYRRIGLAAHFQPVNDIVVGKRKISGTGAGEIGQCVVFVGNLILDFDYRTMSRVLKVPDEGFRERLHRSIFAELSTIRRELGRSEAAKWDQAALSELLAEGFTAVLGPLEPAVVDAGLKAQTERRREWMLSQDWLHRRGRRLKWREVKVRSGVKVFRKTHRASGGLITADFELYEGRLKGLRLSGDFTVRPADGPIRLQRALEGLTPAEAPRALAELYESRLLETPGVTIDDWLAVLPAA